MLSFMVDIILVDAIRFRNMKPLHKIKITWTPNLAYAIGLITTDGCLSKDGRHIDFTSKDEDLVEVFKSCLGLTNKTGRKTRGGSKEKKYFRVQFGDIQFYKFLLQIGLTPAKSKTLGILKIEKEYFPDFLRGCIDGDGSIQIARHPESQHVQLRIRLVSASLPFLNWFHGEILRNFKIKTGWISLREGCYTLSYAKADSILLLNVMYYNNVQSFLNRKYVIAKPFLSGCGETGTRTSFRS